MVPGSRSGAWSRSAQRKQTAPSVQSVCGLSRHQHDGVTHPDTGHLGTPRSSRLTGDAIYGDKRDRNSERCGVCFSLGLRHVLVFVINVEIIKINPPGKSRFHVFTAFRCILIGCVTTRAPGLIYGVPSSSFFFFNSIFGK